jgi:ribonuclease HI
MDSIGMGHDTCGPVVSVDLWEEVLEILLFSTCIFKWVKVPSNVDIEGNERADQLAEKGRNISMDAKDPAKRGINGR